MSLKQDRQGVRTPADLERKYKFGQSFAEAMGIATDAEKEADDAKAAAAEALAAVNGLNQEEIFKRLTNDGEVQGLYVQDGKLYINAEFVQILNLVASVVRSEDEYGGSMGIHGGGLSFSQNGNMLIRLSTEIIGYPSLALIGTQTGLEFRLDLGPDGVYLSSDKGQFFVGLNGEGYPAIQLPGDAESKRISWKANGDGTYTLIGA